MYSVLYQYTNYQQHTTIMNNPINFSYTKKRFFYIVTVNKDFATRSENANEVVSVTTYLRKTVVTIAFVNDFVQGVRVELYRLVALYRCILMG